MKLFLFLMSFSLLTSARADLGFLMQQKMQKNEFKSYTSGPNFKIYSQQVDHHDLSLGTFSQRYWHESKYAEGVNSPVLIYICGEGVCNGISQNTIAKAKLLKAHIFALEHRYYGTSFPVPNLETKNLKYLNVDQALLDLVMFKRSQERELGLNGRWIAIGGSYAGSLAAYLRNQYPDDFVGALSSSGPVKADLDFSEYDAHVAKVAGKDCVTAIQVIVDGIENEIQSSAGFISAKKEFNANSLNDRDDFLYLLADTAAAAVQYGMREKFCEAVVKNGRAGYVAGVELVSQLFGNLENLSAQAAISTAINLGADIGMRQWFYQSCTEFGYWQNVNPVMEMRTRSARINATYHNNLCQRLFGMDAQNVQPTNKKYYEPLLASSSSDILFTNGDEDPWMNLSIVKSDNPEISTMLIPGAAHCDDLGSQGTPAVDKAKRLFDVLSFSWAFIN